MWKRTDISKYEKQLREISSLVVHKSKDVNLAKNNCVGIKFEANGEVSDMRVIRANSKRGLKEVIADFIPQEYIQLRNWDLKKYLN